MTTQRFQRACDASAAMRVADTDFFVTASDEDYLLRVYDRNSPGAPIAELDVSTFLEPVDPTKEPDIEGSAQIGDRVYWIGSHGRDKDGEEQEGRQRLFATGVEVIAGRPSLRTVGRPYKKLLSDLATAPSLAEFDLSTAATRKPEDPGGLNIEGLAATAEGHLLVGFRNPVPAGLALIVRIENPGDVVMGTAAPKVSKRAILDLGGRGVRALEATPDGKLFVLAGSFNDEKDFALFQWDGTNAAPAIVLDGARLNALNAEELVLWPDTPDRVHVFSDDGDALVGEKKCKKAELSARSFRVTAVPLTR